MAGIYIHIPFCKQACHYCDFHFSTSLRQKDDLVAALMKEMELQKNFFQKGAVVETIYFGGGTPSLLDADEIKSLLGHAGNIFNVDSHAEITLEANPDDLDIGKLKSLVGAGVNRLSIGIQSFDEKDLKWMNRAHNAMQSVQSVKDAQDAGFNNITIDLIYGTPLLTDEQWIKNLDTAFNLHVQHLSCYALTVEPRTALAHSIAKKIQPDVDEGKQARHFEILMDMAAQNRFEQYEISNFAKDLMFSRHNSAYWHGEKYLGIGPSAHSFNGESRSWNVRNNAEYVKEISAGKIPAAAEMLTPQNKYNEYVMTTLRTMWGTDLSKIRTSFGDDYAEYFFRQALKMVQDGMLEQQRQHFVLTRKGKLFADHLAAELFIA